MIKRPSVRRIVGLLGSGNSQKTKRDEKVENL